MRRTYNPITIDKEARILYELGVPRYEIESLIMQKKKQELEERWN